MQVTTDDVAKLGVTQSTCGQMNLIIVCGIKELINNVEEKFLVQQIITCQETHLVMVLDGICAIACHPSVFNFHGANLFCTEGREKRDNRIAKSDCSKMCRHGEWFNSGDKSATFCLTTVGFTCGVCAEFSACMWNVHRGKSLCTFCHSEFRVERAQVKIVIVMLLQLLKHAINSNALSHLSVACDTQSHPHHWWSTAHIFFVSLVTHETRNQWCFHVKK